MVGLILVAIAQIADLVTFIATAAVTPIALESNPMMRAAWAVGGVTAVVIFKSGFLTAILAGVGTLERTRWPWVRVTAVAVPVAFGLAGAVANVITLGIVLHHGI